MPQSQLIFRVAGDDGPPITVEHAGFDTTGWTITARFTKPSGEQYTLAAVIDVVGDPGNGIPAEYHFDFGAGDITAGDQLFDFFFAHATLADHATPARFKMTMRVRKA